MVLSLDINSISNKITYFFNLLVIFRNQEFNFNFGLAKQSYSITETDFYYSTSYFTFEINYFNVKIKEYYISHEKFTLYFPHYFDSVNLNHFKENLAKFIIQITKLEIKLNLENFKSQIIFKHLTTHFISFNSKYFENQQNCLLKAFNS